MVVGESWQKEEAGEAEDRNKKKPRRGTAPMDLVKELLRALRTLGAHEQEAAKTSEACSL